MNLMFDIFEGCAVLQNKVKIRQVSALAKLAKFVSKHIIKLFDKNQYCCQILMSMSLCAILF